MPEKILIVDDDIDSLKLIGLMLQKHGYEVLAASAGHQALSKAASDLPDLIILDVMMPDMNGYEVCRRLRKNPETKSIPIIMFTAKTLIDDKVAGFEAGADDYLTKPTHPAELASRVKAILQRNQKQKRSQGGQTGTTIGVIGVKGGVGTTTVALNIAAALQQNGQKPIMVDFHMGNGSLGLYMGMGRTHAMHAVLSKPASEITTSYLKEQLITHSTGLHALAASANPQESLYNYNHETATALVACLRQIGQPTVCDLGSGYSPLSSQLHKEMDTLILVVEALGTTLIMARELLAELNPKGQRRIEIVVVNRTENKLQPTWHEVETALDHEILATIAAAPELAFEANEAGAPMVNIKPNAIVSNQLSKLAEDVLTIQKSAE